MNDTTRPLTSQRLRALARVVMGSILAAPLLPAAPTTQATDLFDLDLEALTKVEVKSAAGLTKMDSRRAPVALTELGVRDILGSGAKDLNHLFDVYVPNAQLIDHHHLQPHIGFRGIISDREDKYLLQVNGRTMNSQTFAGGDNERAIPLLGDLASVNVVRGPASATHGAGAIAGVVSLQTYTGLTFEGADLALRQSVVDQYTAAELRYGKKLGDTRGVFFYYGVADQQGADSDYYIGKSYPAVNGLPANVAGQPSAAPIKEFGHPGFGALRHKLHLSYVDGPLEVWFRFVQDGNEDRPMREIYTMTKPATQDTTEWVRGRQTRNRQSTVTARYRRDVSEQWSVDLMQSVDRWDSLDQRHGVFVNPIRHLLEDESFSRAIAVWTPSEKQSLGFGAEYSHIWYQDPAQSDALDRAPIVTKRHWQTNAYALLAEHQWKLSNTWTSFLSARADKHTYSDWLFAPRGSLVWTASEADTVKFMVGKAVRRGGDEELWAEHVRKGTIPAPESLLSYEIGYEHRLTPQWTVGANAFVEDYDAIGWVPALYLSSSIGEYRIGGADLQATYRSGKTRVTISEGIAKLMRASVPASLPTGGQGITAKPYGYGNDLAEWAPFITKIAVTHDLSKAWSMSASVVHYSGFPGAKDYRDFAATFPVPPSAMPVSDPGFDTPYGANLFVNFGLEFRPSERLTVRFDAYNLADLVDDTISKRNYYFRMSEFSIEPASAAVSIRYRF